jgi:hypothetical protein
MEKIDQVGTIKTKHKKGLIILVKKLLKFMRESQESEKIKLTNDTFESIITINDDFRNVVKSISNVSAIKNYIPLFIIELYCGELMKDLLKENILEDEKISGKIDHLLEDLEMRIEEWDVIIPLENIELNGLECVEIGGVELLHPNKVKEIFNNEKIFSNWNLDHSLDKDEIQNKVGAHVKIKFDSQEIYDPALLKVEPIINILRIYAHYNLNVILNSPLNGIKVKIGICGSVNSARRHIISYIPGEAKGMKSSGIGHIPRLIVNKEFLDDIKNNYKFQYIEYILNKKKTSKYENQILRAIRWIGLGIDDDIGTDKIIKFSIALECLVLTRNDKSKTEALAERCAYILGKSSKERQDIPNEVKYFYDLRSDIVHDGKDSINEVDINAFRELVTKCLFKLVEINDKEKLRDNDHLKELIQSEKIKAISKYREKEPWF